MFFDRFTGGVYVFIIKNNKYRYYFGENSWWIIDDWESDINSGKYFEIIEQLTINYADIREGMIELLDRSENSILNYLPSKLPSIYIDFDNKLFLSTYFDQALEDRMIEGWTGKYESFLHLIPEEYHYWVIDGVDYSKPNKPE